MFKKIKETRIYEHIVDQVFEAILRGDLKPADKLPSENELGQIFGVSRVTVREAIRHLENMGVLEVRQGSMGGAYIKEVDLGDTAAQMSNVLRVSNVTFFQIAEARAVLEHMILGQLLPVERLQDLVEKLEGNLERAEEHFKNEDNARRLQTNFEFHAIIAETTENPIIVLMHKIIVELSLGFFENVKPSDTMARKTFQDHRRIIDLLKQENLKEAAQACADHISKVSGRIVDKSNQQSVLFKKISGKEKE